MVCRACGRIIANENANFCEYCGTAIDAGRDGGRDYNPYAGEGAETSTYHQDSFGAGYANGAGRADNSCGAGHYGAAGYGQAPTGTPGLAGILNGTAGTAEAESSMSFVHWIVIMALPYVPMIGTIAYLVLLFIWAFGRTASKTRKNWARATIVITAAAMLMVSYMLQNALGSEGLAELMNSMLGGVN